MSDERSPVIRDLFASLDLADGEVGQIDWVSGIYRINRTHVDWEQYFQEPSQDPDLTRTLLHEMHHFLQISAFSYLHRFASLMYYSIGAVVQRHYGDLTALPSRLDHDKDIRDAVWDMQFKESGEVSVIEIVESLTNFVEENSVKGYPTAAYVAILNRPEVPDAYRNGFLHFVQRCGSARDLAVLFPVACHMSLCSLMPRRCFNLFADAVRSHVLTANSTYDDFLSFCWREDENYGGYAWDWRRRAGNQIPLHPIFGMLETSLEGNESMGENFRRYVLSPHNCFDPFQRMALSSPIVFNSRPDSEVAGYEEWPVDSGLALRNSSPAEKKAHILWLLYMSVASRRYLGRMGVPPPGVRPVT